MTGSAAAVSCSCGGLKLGHRLQRADLMAAREGEKRLFRRGAVRKISVENSLDGTRRVLGNDIAINFASERGVRPKAAADQNVVTLDRIGFLIGLDLAGEEPDLGDKMLRARVVAASQVNVDRRVER